MPTWTSTASSVEFALAGAPMYATQQSTATRKKVTIVTCAFNEEDCVDELARRLFGVFDAMPQYDFEIIAVENGSHDRTLERMQAIRESDNRFTIIQLARNFGLDGGFAAGLDAADGDAVVLMAADLQDPPEILPQFIERWEDGYFNVYGVVANRPSASRLRRTNSAFFYWLIGKLSEYPLPKNARDFRLLDRDVYERVRSIQDPHPFHRGLAAWTGFPSVGVEFDQPPRFGGKTKASSRGVSEFAVRSIFTQSMTPLRIMPLMGVLLVTIAVLALLGLAINSLVNGVPFPGFGTILAVVIMMFGVLFCFLSIIGIYVGLIFEQVRVRPNYIVHRQWGLGDETVGPSKQYGHSRVNGAPPHLPDLISMALDASQVMPLQPSGTPDERDQNSEA
jgi:glycosyltransferase involved in cell wall biosynthesis